MTILEKGLESLGFDANRQKEILPLLTSYVSEIELFNASYDLVGATSRDEIYTRHILDSLAPAAEIRRLVEQAGFTRENPPLIVDIGSGAGLPGIPLAIRFPEYSFVLLERMSRRCAFLENVVSVLQLKNVRVVNDDIAKYTAERFDFAVFRAFRPLDVKITTAILNVLKPNGIAFAYKGKEKKIAEEMRTIQHLLGSWEIRPLNVPFLDDTERHLVVFSVRAV